VIGGSIIRGAGREGDDFKFFKFVDDDDADAFLSTEHIIDISYNVRIVMNILIHVSTSI